LTPVASADACYYMIDRGLMQLARGEGQPNGRWADADRLARRLLKHCDSLFTFLDHPDVPYDDSCPGAGCENQAPMHQSEDRAVATLSRSARLSGDVSS
jgi:hypothetical protein